MKSPHLIKAVSRRMLLACLPLLIPFSVVADETEIFFQGDASSVNANVLFILDASGSMAQDLSGGDGTTQTRMQVMKDAFREVMSEIPANINVGLMHYANATNNTGYDWDSIKGINFPVSPADQDASEVIGSFASSDNISASTSAGGTELKVAEFLADVVDTWRADGYTPIVDSLYEAARYFRGEEVVWGKYPAPYNWAAHPSTYTGNLSCASTTTESCVSNWGQCNGTEHSCVDDKVSSCCNWISNGTGNGDTSSGGYCENDNYSCKSPISRCQHEVCDTISGAATYNTPIEEVCQSNYLVLMSDGKPEYPYFRSKTADGVGRFPESVYPGRNYASNIPNLTPEITSTMFGDTIPDLVGGDCEDSPYDYPSGTCGKELTQFLADNDQNSDLDGDQVVETYTVAFGLGDEPKGTNYLASLATADGGTGAFTADNADELVDAFKSVFSSIEKKSFSFSSPSFSVSEDSLLSHGSNVYIPVMDVGQSAIWSGNLRKFTLNSDGNIVNRDGSTAALTKTGDFSEDAQGLWSDAVHGQEVKQGGVANKLPAPAVRDLYTDAGSNTLVSLSADSSVADLPSSLFSRGTYKTKHRLQDWLLGADGQSIFGWYTDCDGKKQKVRPWTGSNVIKGPVDIEAVTTCVESPVSTAQRDTLLNFLRGYADGVAAGDKVVARKHLGDMLNTKPVVVTYKGATAADDKTMVLVTTNEGYLHAIDAETGVEDWGFMPASLLSNQQTFLSDSAGQGHTYGIDGPMTLWQFKDDADNDKKYLFFSLRRGGNMIYTVDISAASTPKIVWKIDPAGERGAVSTGFSGLGETWSKPTLSRMRNPSDPAEMIHVLVFGGGYDPRMDESDPADRGTGDYQGSDVYIVNALTGARIWSLKGSSVTGSSSLTDSVPGDIRVLDMDNDGGLDRLYFADTGGHIWRVDMSNSVTGVGDAATVSLNAKLTKFADLGAVGGGETDRRKFFYEPDTALRLADGVPVLTVSIGSGYRTHPLDTGDADRFYVLLDENVYRAPPADFTTITESSLMSVTELRASTEENILNIEDKRGWYYPLAHNGEKVLATSLTFLDKVIFTTFAIADDSGAASETGTCQPAMNTSRAYILDLLTGKPVANLDRESETTGSGSSAVTTTTKDDFLVAGFNEILDSPQLIFSALTAAGGGDCTQSDCQQSVSVRIGKLNIPVLDTNNANTDGGGYGGSVDLTTLLPRLYWRDDDVPASGDLTGVDTAP